MKICERSKSGDAAYIQSHYFESSADALVRLLPRHSYEKGDKQPRKLEDRVHIPSFSNISCSVSDAMMTPIPDMSKVVTEIIGVTGPTIFEFLASVAWLPDDTVVQTTLVERVSHLVRFEAHRPIELGKKRMI